MLGKFITKRVKTVVTIGPASNSKEILENLVRNGASVFRLNFSHGNFEEHKSRVNLINSIREKLNRPISIMLDTKGPEIRTHNFKDGEVEIFKNSEIKIYLNKEIEGNSNEFSITYSSLGQEIKTGQIILIDDGKLELLAKEIEAEYILCKALNTHTVKNRRAINIPNIHLNLDFLSEQDKKDIAFGIKELNVDYVAASFVNTAEDIVAMREFLDANEGSDVQIIAKIENQTAIDHIDEIINVSDGIMFARGDLGVEIPFEKVPLWEKRIIRKCNMASKPIIIATQMLESMTENPLPTRAEVSDVYWAVDLGTDSTMLSAESANGLYPLEAVRKMTIIIREAERHFWHTGYRERFVKWNLNNNVNIDKSILDYADEIAKKALESKIHHIIIFDESENMELTKKISLIRARANIIPIVEDERQWTAFGIYYGVYPELVENRATFVNDAQFFSQIANKYGAKIGNEILIVTATELKVAKFTKNK